MIEHTKEPWEAVTDCPGKCCWHIQPVGHENRGPWDRINSPEMSEADARRIVACVNACQGIPTNMLVAAGQSAVMARTRADELEAQNAQLLAELSTACQQVKTERRLSFRDQAADLERQRDELLALVESAFKEGFCAPATYNDTVLNDMDGEWEKSESRAAIAKVKS